MDVWLWRARFFKTRGLASRHVESRGVRVDRSGAARRAQKPSAKVAPGDVLTFSVGPRIHVVEILALGHRRGPAVEAAALYQASDGGE